MKDYFAAGLLASVLMGWMSAGCGDDALDDIDQYTDCIDICERYQDCVDEDYDTDACSDRCQENENMNGTSDVDACEDCLDDMSCAASAFECPTECAGIVP